MKNARLLALILLCAVAPALAIECYTPLAWQPKLTNTPRDQNNNFIDDSIDSLPSGTLVDVLLNLNRCPEPAEAAHLASFGTLVYRSRYVSLMAINGVLSDKLPTLAAHERVAYVEGVQDFRYFLDTSNQAMKVRASGTYTPNTVADQYPGITGSGVTIAIIDGGVDDGVHDFIPGAKFVGGTECDNDGCGIDLNPDDEDGHGTHVAAIALGTGGSLATHLGLAPDARLVDIRVCNAAGACAANGVGHALERILDRRDQWDVDVVNISVGSCSEDNGTNGLAAMINLLVDEGISVVVAVGNTDVCSDMQPDTLITYLASADEGITVGQLQNANTVDRADDLMSINSLNGPRQSDGDDDMEDELKPDLAAPGVGIESALFNTANGLDLRGGTSMAAPHVAGCAALLVQASSGAIPPTSLRRLLIETAEDKDLPGWDIDWGWGELDCFEAVDGLEAALSTDLGFVVYKKKPGPDKWWKSPELYPTDDTVEEGEANTIVAEITNFGPNDAGTFSVNLGIYNFSNSDADYHICTREVAGLLNGQTTTVSCPYTPSISGPDPGQVHACLKAEVVYPYDDDFDNNEAQHNVNVKQTSSPAIFSMGVVNPTEDTLTMDLRETFQCACLGWTFTPSDDNFVMDADDCPRTVDLELEPVDPNAPLEAEVDVEVIGIDSTGEEQSLGGVTIIARIGCQPENLAFQNDEDFSWDPSIYTACPGVFDVARGDLSIVSSVPSAPGGDFSAATCLENDDGDLTATDSDVPALGGGFYYLVRAGIAPPGSWNTGAQRGDRDKTLGACP